MKLTLAFLPSRFPKGLSLNQIKPTFLEGDSATSKCKFKAKPSFLANKTTPDRVNTKQSRMSNPVSCLRSWSTRVKKRYPPMQYYNHRVVCIDTAREIRSAEQTALTLGTNIRSSKTAVDPRVRYQSNQNYCITIVFKKSAQFINSF